jgi:hypothetical protein
MARAAPFLALALVAGVMAGCLQQMDEDDGDVLGPGAPIDHAAIAKEIGEPIVMLQDDDMHDHTDPSHHMQGHNMELVAWDPLTVELGENGFANFVFHVTDDEELLFIAIDGDETGGFLIVDIEDPGDMRVLGEYWIRGTNVQEVRVSPDGDWAVMNVQHIPSVDDVLAAGPTDCWVCIHVVDVRDRNDPQLSSLFPVELLGTHNMDFHVIDDELYLFYVGQPLLPGNTKPGNYVGAARLFATPEAAVLVDTGYYTHLPTYGAGERSFPHDVIVDRHPITGQDVAYISHWDGGAVTVDVSLPQAPVLLGVNTEMEPSGALAIHWFAPEPHPREDGRLIAWSAPEIGALDSDAGAVRAYDVTDPADFRQIGSWLLPGEVWIPGAFIFSGHIVIPDMDRGLLAVSHYHAGVWILDITDPEDPRHLAYYLPHTDPQDPYDGPIWWKKPNFDPEGFMPNVYQARWYDELLFVSERGTGLYVLEYTGPVPGPI